MPQWWERSPYFHATNTNKRGVTIDMSGAEGRALALRLVAECDVVVENYSPRVMESWGLSWEDVRAVNPTRSWCGCRRSACRGRGATGPGSP